MAGLFKYFVPSLTIRRTKLTLVKKTWVWQNEGIKYPGFKYYPRHKDFQDPPYQPSKLFRVNRIKPLKGVNYIDRKILEEFKLDGKPSEYVIIKNIPESNMRLYRVKHLVRIVPITFPDGFPEDINGTYLKENGELEVIKRVNIDEKRLELSDKFKKSIARLDGDTLRRNSRLKWLNGFE